MAPDSFRRKGDLNNAGKPFPRSSWRIQSQCHVSENADEIVSRLNGCLRDVLSRLERNGYLFCQLAIEEKAGLLIGISADSVPPMIIEGDILQQISALKLSYLEIDLII